MDETVAKLKMAAQHASGRMAATGFQILLEVQPSGLFVRVKNGAGHEKVGALTWREVVASTDGSIINYVTDRLMKG